METTHSRGGGRQHQPTTIPTTTQPLPRLMRSRSGATAMSLPENHACNINNSFNSSSQRFINNRSKSTTRTRNQKNNNNEENVNPSSMQKNKEGSKDGFVRFLQRGSGPRSSTTTPVSAAKNNNKVTKSVTNSPSAWALSPGRTSLCMVAPESPSVTSRAVKVKSSSGGGGGVSGILKYFRQKKVSPIQEEEYRNFRVVHNRLVQYRFANARAEATMASLNNVAQAEKILYMVTELASTLEQEDEYLKELDTIIPQIPTLLGLSKFSNSDKSSAIGLTVIHQTYTPLNPASPPNRNTSAAPIISNTHIMTTRVKNGIYKPKVYQSSQSSSNIDMVPSTVTEALRHTAWRQAM
ncbi:hypothetical protein LWI29_005656 [Acer saccharum]|uniref:Uncharacterized protein n=1 Tax=Acer saccharum TaxID=4024 RepID=A0AA39VYG7_ACESA|nr:hypothetical protein LWI29_005656 [Acer saccharum]